MTIGMQTWMYIALISVVVLVILFYILRTIINQRFLAHRLASFAEDIHAYGRSSLHTKLLQCGFCRNTSHVHVWKYGNANVTKEAFICYLCVSRIQKLLDPSLTRKGVSAYDLHQSSLRDEHPLDRSRSR